MSANPFYRVFICHDCSRIISICRPRGSEDAEPTIEPIHSCAVCTKEKK